MWQQFLVSLLPGLIQMLAGKDSTASNLASLFGQGYQTAQNYQNQQENQDWQRSFAMQQFEYNRMLNDRSFFHSLPSTQIEHYKNAGLSPDLMNGQLSPMNFGTPVNFSQPNASAPNFAGLENANLSKDLSKKDSDISLNISKKSLNEVDFSLKKIEESFQQLTLNDRIDLVFLEKQFKQITNELQQSNVEENVINNMKLASSLGLIRGINKDGRVTYTTTPKFKEICSYYLKSIQQDFDIKVQELENLEKKFEEIEKNIKLKDSEILINSVAYQQDILNLITNAIGSGVSLVMNEETGVWEIDYDQSTGDKTGIIAMGLISTVLDAIGVRFSFGKGASKVMPKKSTEPKSKPKEKKDKGFVDVEY